MLESEVAHDLAKERMDALQNSINYIEQLESQRKEQRRIHLFNIAKRLCKQGYSAKVVRRTD
ncbi:hypothetical protein AAGS61_02815 [Lysinibacillus sp. KU-BSD001]|uniref:hypothetical protein n=1 Tax=Lysinibacillus sp. KU-BSD001 TaxID=3141328 RepID=UPI0036E33751